MESGCLYIDEINTPKWEVRATFLLCSIQPTPGLGLDQLVVSLSFLSFLLFFTSFALIVEGKESTMVAVLENLG